jgi:hypothetical protein
VADTKPKNGPALAKAPLTWQSPYDEIRTIVQKAEGGDAAALSDVRGLIKSPAGVDMLGGNVARETLRKLVDRYAGDNPVVRETVTRKVEDLRSELSGEHPSALEKLLVDRILACWLHLNCLEGVYASKDSLTTETGLYFQKALSAAQKRYLAAIKGLADVRRLALPALQINIAKKQLNVTTGTAVTG